MTSLTVGYPFGAELMRSTGAGALSELTVIAGALADIAIGIGIVAMLDTPRSLRCARVVAFLCCWEHDPSPRCVDGPTWPLLKIAPIFMLHLVALAILDER